MTEERCPIRGKEDGICEESKTGRKEGPFYCHTGFGFISCLVYRIYLKEKKK